MIAASAGNHALGLTYHASLLKIPVTVVMPRFAPLTKVANCRRLGAEVILDGGVRRGTDVLKALALGAKAVSFARPYLYGLAAAGEAGVRRAFSILAEGVHHDMALLGARTVSEIDRSCVQSG